MTKPNPWGLTASQEATCREVVRQGSMKLACETMGKSDKTMESHLFAAKKRMKAVTRLQCLILFDRWDRYL